MMSIFIPRVFININEARIKNVFESLLIGKVDHVDFVYKKSHSKGKADYYSAYVFFKEWYKTSAAANLLEKISQPGKEAKIVYDDPWFWVVLKNNSQQEETKPVKKYVRREKIVVNEEKQQKFEESLKAEAKAEAESEAKTEVEEGEEKYISYEELKNFESYMRFLELQHMAFAYGNMLAEYNMYMSTYYMTEEDYKRCDEYFENEEDNMTEEDYKRCEEYLDMVDKMDECQKFMDEFESSTTVYYNTYTPMTCCY